MARKKISTTVYITPEQDERLKLLLLDHRLHHARAGRAAEAPPRPDEGPGGRVHPAGDRSRAPEVPRGSPRAAHARWRGREEI